MWQQFVESMTTRFEKIAANIDVVILKFFSIILIIVVGRIAVWLIIKFTKKLLFNKHVKASNKISEKKMESIYSLAKSVVKFFVWFFVIVAVLDQVGISAGSLLATAGIGGVAIAFGAQDLVKDMVSGGFLFVESQYEIGDLVKVADVMGTVQGINIRNTEIKAYTGEVVIIPNGSIGKVINYSKGNNLAILDIGIAYEEDIQQAANSILATARSYKEKHDYVVGEPQYAGVISLGESDVTLRVVMDVKPAMQFQTQRDLLQAVKENFDKENIEIPYPRRVIINQ
ncbi:MAG: mechanosensitive ion channel family protein [Eubacteriales bacterium]